MNPRNRPLRLPATRSRTFAPRKSIARALATASRTIDFVGTVKDAGVSMTRERYVPPAILSINKSLQKGFSCEKANREHRQSPYKDPEREYRRHCKPSREGARRASASPGKDFSEAVGLPDRIPYDS